MFRSTTGQSALNGPLVSAPSLPNPVVDGDLPVRLEMNSMNSSGKFLIVNRVVHGERRQIDLGIGRIVPPPGQHRVDGKMHGPLRGDFALEPRRDFGQIRFARILEVRPLLQVARILATACRSRRADARKKRRRKPSRPRRNSRSDVSSARCICRTPPRGPRSAPPARARMARSSRETCPGLAISASAWRSAPR